MQVLLRTTVPNLGKKGDVKQVKPGFFRNYLFPQGKAMSVTPRLLKSLVKAAEVAKNKVVSVEKEALKLKDALAKRSLTFEKKVTKAPKIYGSVGAADIVTAVENTFNIKITKDQVILPEALKTIGGHVVMIALTPTVHAPVTVTIKEAA